MDIQPYWQNKTFLLADKADRGQKGLQKEKSGQELQGSRILKEGTPSYWDGTNQILGKHSH